MITGLIVLAVIGVALIGLAAFATPGLTLLIPALAIPDIAQNLLGVLAMLASVIGIVVASFYSFRLISPLVRAFAMSYRETVFGVSEESLEQKAAAECNERLQRAISYRIALSGLLRPEAYRIECTERMK
jgi:phage-related protein